MNGVFYPLSPASLRVLRRAGLLSSASDSPDPAQSQALTGGAAAAPLLVLSGFWQPLGGLVSSQLLHCGPLGKQHAVQELGGEKQGWGGMGSAGLRSPIHTVPTTR